MFSQIKRKYIEQNFHSIAGVLPQGWDLGCWGFKNFSVGICDGGPSTTHSCIIIAGIVTFISMLNATSETLKARKIINLKHLKFYEQFK